MPRYRLIFVPGMMGSSLEVILPGGTSRVVWDGELFTLLRTLLAEPQVLHAATRLKPVKIIEELTIGGRTQQDIYKKLFSFLHNDLSYDEQTFFPFPYDWRQSVFNEAKRLIDFIENLPSGDQPIVLLGHSLGALVTRAAVVMMDQAKLTSVGITSVIELAPPHLGSSLAFQEVLDSSFFRQLIVTYLSQQVKKSWPLRLLRRILVRFPALFVPFFDGQMTLLARSMPPTWQLFPPETVPILVNNTNSSDIRAALDWPSWTDAVQRMVRQTAEDFHKHTDEIPRKWPGSIRECVAYCRSFNTPHTFPFFDLQSPYGIALNGPITEPGDSVVREKSATVWPSMIQRRVDYPHSTIAGDPKTLDFLRQELQ